MLVSIVLSVFLIVSTSWVHYLALRWLSGGMARIAMTPSVRILLIVLAVLTAHLVEIAMYACAYAFAGGVLGLGSLGGLAVLDPLDYYYFSIVSFTSLGLGDVLPGSHLRFITGVEALNGLLLIAWSGSFIYVAMGRLWPWESCSEPSDPAAPENTRKPAP